MPDLFSREGLVRSEQYAETMNHTVLPYLRERRQEVAVSGADGKKIICDRYLTESPKGTVTLLHGFTECAAKFSELTFSLLKNGYCVLAYDQRGHGRSWRDERISDLSLTHVERFEEYVGDLKAVADQVLQKMPGPRYLFSHSMGGAVSILFLEQYPGIFDKAAFCAPMIAPHRAGLPLFLGKALCSGAKLIGRGQTRVPISQPWSGPEEFATSCATGRERFAWYDDLRVRTRMYQNNGPSFSWTLEAFNVTSKILAPGRPESVRIPIRIYTAGEDNQVLPEAQEMLASRLPNGKRKVIAGARHEIYRSSDDILFPWWAEILRFFSSGS